MFRNKRILLLAAAGVLVITGATIGLIKTGVFESSAKKQQKAITAQNNSKKEAVLNHNGNQSAQSSDGKSAGNDSTYTPPTTANGITITPSQPDSGHVTIVTKLAGYSDGTCNLSITNGAKTTSQTAQVVYAPEFSTCAGFSVPVSSLGSGAWDISLTVTSGGVTNTRSTDFTVR